VRAPVGGCLSCSRPDRTGGRKPAELIEHCRNYPSLRFARVGDVGEVADAAARRGASMAGA